VVRTEKITVVVMTRDRSADLRRSLRHHEAPVIVLDNDSSTPLAEAVAQVRPDAECLRLPRNLGAVARNIGVRRATTDYVAFADDDSWWAPGSLARAVAVMEAHPRLAVLAGKVVVGADQLVDSISVAMAGAPLGQDSDLPGPNIAGFLACGAVVRRSAFLSVHGFDPVVFFAGEEERLTLDLLSDRWGLAYVDEVVSQHMPAQRTCAAEAARRSLLARNAVLTAWMRRPVPVAARRTLRLARAGADQRAGVRAAVRRMPGALARRHRVPAHVEELLRGLEGDRQPPY
jgi:hypothetical protein